MPLSQSIECLWERELLFSNPVGPLPHFSGFRNNQKLAQDKIINYTRSVDRRVNLAMGVSYESDIQKAIEVMKEEPAKVEGVQAEKGVTVFLDNFGDYSINFIVRYWINTKKRGLLDVKTDVGKKIKEGFDREGIEIPFPTRLTLRKNVD